ncbi:MAG: hypothetical protein A2W19_00240 [Spirochaetes bacterium RBG_16_49_21]|nr:MAG: hypothetical protein A2W19_00240 [Spirochaetes bacterium RBG_16_49_21]
MLLCGVTKITEEIAAIHRAIYDNIEARLREFRSLWEKGSDRELFVELVFCLLTPQSGARRCWRAVESLVQKDFLFNGCFDDICGELNIVRFKNNKTRYIMEAREVLWDGGSGSIREALSRFHNAGDRRDWLFRNVKGMGYKEASHYLRNIGLGEDIAILDRHIVKNMHLIGLIDSIPKAMPRRVYLDSENALHIFADRVAIPVSHLDFVLWYKETGDLFK